MARILVAVSSIGLGHAARARVYGSILKERGHIVEYYAPEPAYTYLKAWGHNIIPESKNAVGLSLFLEKHWEKTGKSIIGLRASLAEHRAALKNSIMLLNNRVFEKYDIVIAEESWEIISIVEKVNIPKIWISDFIGYKPVGLASIPAAYAVNRFLYKRYKFFDKLYYVGLIPVDSLNWRMLPYSPKAREVFEEYFDYIGPLPPVMLKELMDKDEARGRLGLNHDRLLLVQLGGTRAGIDIIKRVLPKSLEAGLTPVVFTGPRVSLKLKKGIIRGYNPRLPQYYRAFDCAYVLAGLMTLTGLAIAGIPALLNPLPGHFEQEENAVFAELHWRTLFSRSPRHPGRMLKVLDETCSKRQLHGDSSLEDNIFHLVNAIEVFLKI